MEDDELLRSFYRERHTHTRTGHMLTHMSNDRTQEIGYSKEYVGKIVKGIMQRAGVNGTCHSLRREFITSAYHANGDEGLVKIMHIVGHENIKETLGYIKKEPSAMREVLKARRFFISNKAIND